MSLINKIKPRIDALRLRLFYFFAVKHSFSKRKKRVLIIKNDSIGDYIISRNFLEETVKSERFKDYELYLLTNTKLAPIAQQLDGKLIKEILLVQKTFATMTERLGYYSKLKSYGFEYVLHPTYSPDSGIQHLLKYIDARYKIGFEGDTSNQTATDKAYFEQYYTHLIPVANKFSHEFEKNVVFFNAALQQAVSITKPTLTVHAGKTEKHQIAICPGAQHAFRIWSLANFGALISLLNKKFPDCSFVVVTGPGEEALYTGIAAATAVPLSHFKIDSTLNLAALISASALVVCNDSSSAHLAVACGINSVCISNGNHYSRFVPYPTYMHIDQKVVLPPAFLNDLKKKDTNTYYFGSTLDINEITVQDVYAACEPYLESRRA